MKTIPVVTILLAWLCLLPVYANAQEESAIAPDNANTVEAPATDKAPGGLIPSLIGTPWKQILAPGADRPENEKAHYLKFEIAGKLTSIGECKQFWGKYQLPGDDKLLVTDLRANRKDCADIEAGDQRFTTTLVMANSFRIEDGSLKLYQDGRHLMTFGVAPEMPAVEPVPRRPAKKAQKHAPSKKTPGKPKASKTKPKAQIKKVRH